MCGIVGYNGSNQAINILIEGLRKLEYRGYDSAGFAVLENGAITTTKAKGKLQNLENKIGDEAFSSVTGISHTRWATHGAPSEENSHPHLSADGKVAVVHNGIIENYAVLKEMLLKDGYEFKSETDTEVIPHLIQKFYTGDLEAAVLTVLGMLEGAFGIGVITSDEPGVMIGARRGSPLVVGVADDGIFIASDVTPIVEHTKQVIYLDDDDVVVSRDGKYEVKNIHNQRVNREVHEIDFDLEAIAKGGFDHFMLKEIYEQPNTVENALRGRLLLGDGTAKLDGLKLNLQELRGIRRIIMLACGTSYYASLVGELIIEDLAGIPVEVEYASEFRYKNPIIEPHTIVFAISQSGETADTLAALREAKRKGATVLGICNTVGSSIARETDGGVYLHAGSEIGVASTKAFTSQVTVLTLVALLLGRMRRVSHEYGADIVKGLQQIPEHINTILSMNSAIEEIASKFAGAENFLYLGRHFNYPVAMEGALKLKEISYIHAEGYPAAEMKHGPIALIDENMPVVVIAPNDTLFDKVVSNIEEVKARGGRIIAICNESNDKMKHLADFIIPIPATLPMLMPLLTAIPMQLLAYHIACIRGCDVDKPRNLAKSVTVE
ncbi:MAG: glutamine--fructose-6-phosphate transaminase (isomerizing) [Fibrobacterales bacterium]